MPRIRTIKPTFFKSLTIARLDFRARLLFIGLWTEADDEGRLIYEPRLIKAAIFPLDDDVTASDIEADVTCLERAGFVVRYVVADETYLCIPKWRKHQRVNRPSPSDHPAPPEDSGSTHGTFSEDSRQEGNKEQGKDQGKEVGKEKARREPLDDWTPNDFHKDFATRSALDLRREEALFRQSAYEKRLHMDNPDRAFMSWLKKAKEWGYVQRTPTAELRMAQARQIDQELAAEAVSGARQIGPA